MKYTSYETSKKLHELGFKSDTNCGWWGIWHPELRGDQIKTGRIPQWIDFATSSFSEICKAYDCFDLLMWLQKELEGLSVADLAFDKTSFYYLSNRKEDTTTDPNPTEALAKAVIKILEEKE